MDLKEIKALIKELKPFYTVGLYYQGLKVFGQSHTTVINVSI